jgi:hypothetical protein
MVEIIDPAYPAPFCFDVAGARRIGYVLVMADSRRNPDTPWNDLWVAPHRVADAVRAAIDYVSAGDHGPLSEVERRSEARSRQQFRDGGKTGC